MAYLDKRDGQLMPAIVVFDPKLKKRLRFATMKEAFAYELAMRNRDKPADEKAPEE
jgi:hypothetical protein